MEKLLTQGKLPLAQIKPRGRLLRAAAGRWEEQKPGRKGEAMCFQTGRLRGQNTMGPDHGVTSLERARRPPFQDAQCGCAPRAHQGRGATGFPGSLAAQTRQSRNAWWRCHVISFPSPASRAFQGRPVSPPSPALPLPPLACRSRVGGLSRQAGIPPQSSALKREGRRRGEEGEREGREERETSEM